jgi:type IV pilus assembly protein PilY1
MRISSPDAGPVAGLSRAGARGWRAASLALSLCVAPLPSIAQLTLSQAPAGSGGREPAPNVIVSVDDSGSMDWDLQGCPPASSVRYDSEGGRNWFGQLFDADGRLCPAKSDNQNPTRMMLLRQALRNTFGNPDAPPPNKGSIPDGRIRLAWQAMWNNGAAPGAGTLTAGAANSMKSFEGAHRSAFEAFVASLRALNGTPTHKLLSSARAYLQTPLGVSSPWAKAPGVTGAPYLECRRAFQIVMTDGAWNDTSASGNVGNADGTSTTLGDGSTRYLTTSVQTRVYRDPWGGTKGTLADWSFANWATDLQPELPNRVRPYFRQSATERIGGVSVEPYWNPRNDPATWQHLSTYTIGFGKSATSWSKGPRWDSLTDDTYGGEYALLWSGTKTWPDAMSVSGNDPLERPFELWHMALNGRGRYYPARTGEALSLAFADILSNIVRISANPLVAIGTSSSSLRTPGEVYLAGYNSADWSGSLVSRRIGLSGVIDTASGNELWRADSWLDAPTTAHGDRVILTSDGDRGIPFRWASLSDARKALLKGVPAATDAVGEARLNYIRGDRSGEGTGSEGFRVRSTRLGDIVNSGIWFTGAPASGMDAVSGYTRFRADRAARPGMLYLGANDGMLHGFRASDGRELLAYVPLGVHARLAALSSPTQSHRYTVDGTPFTGDAVVGGAWRTVLVGTLGLGGPGFFVLDVNDPGSFRESSAQSLVLMDKTDGTDPDLGHIVAAPLVNDNDANVSAQIVRTNDGQWSVLLGNGVNSANQRPVLLVQNLSDAAGLTKVVAGGLVAPDRGNGNGLSAPRLIDLDGNGTVDLVYAGDLNGNLWRFNLRSPRPQEWAAEKIYLATDRAGAAQPITGAPMVMVHPRGGLMVAFGTGRNLTDADPASTSPQTLYAIWDRNAVPVGPTGLRSATAFSGRTALVAQTVGDPVQHEGTSYWKTSANAVDYTGSPPAKLGWFLDYPGAGERTLANASVLFGNLLLVWSSIPRTGAPVDEESCTPGGRSEQGWGYALDILTGRPPRNLFDVVDANDAPVTGLGRFLLGTSSDPLVLSQGKTLVVVSTDGSQMPKRMLRPVNLIRGSFAEF